MLTYIYFLLAAGLAEINKRFSKCCHLALFQNKLKEEVRGGAILCFSKKRLSFGKNCWIVLATRAAALKIKRSNLDGVKQSVTHLLMHVLPLLEGIAA